MKIKINNHTIEGEEKDVLKIAKHIINKEENENEFVIIPGEPVKFSNDEKIPLKNIRLTKEKTMA